VIAGEISRALRSTFGASAAKEFPGANLASFVRDMSAKSTDGTKLAPGSIVAGRASELAAAGIDCGVAEGYRISVMAEPAPLIVLSGKTDVDVLYAAFRFIRFLQTATPLSAISLVDAPKVKWRMLDHWDNPDGSIERGYAGKSLWKWDELPGKVDPRYTDYARACASIGLNASCLNNVNASALALSTEYLRKSAAIADAFRPYGVRVFLSANFAAPKTIGGLSSADPCDPAVAAWWAAKADEIYSLIPDFGGFVVKADSEGQPGPFAYGRTHADGANMLAKALDRHGGIVIWRAFVYGHGESDRAKKAYAQFKPHDGEFAANAAIQVKNGPIDFQPREPVSPLFGAMEKTPTFMEFQITQEYLGQGNHLVYLAPMWKEILDFDTFSKGPNTSVARVLSTEGAPGGFSGIAAVSNIGNDRNWCGHHFHAANWFAFGRLAWDPTLDEWEIAREWISCTWGGDPVASETIFSMMRDSWPACVDYMTPLCLHHIMNEGHHYGPNPGDLTPIREDWRPRYYHRASRTGLGFDRTREGSGAVDQYFPPVRDLFADPKRCPEKYLVWFHHVPWERTLQSGRTLMDEIEFRYGRGVRAAESMLARWKSLEGKIDGTRFRHVLAKLEIQLSDAREWESTCVPYFRSFTKYRNVLGECGYSEETIDAKISAAWDAIFVDPETRFYFESDDGGAYFMDTGNNDARTEGMSYGMMMAVQMNRKDVFDRMWKWSKEHMFMKDGWNAGYFAWSCALDGRHNAEGPAPDGEEYFAMALFLASRRWGEGEGIFAYAAEARGILRACVHKGEPGNPGDPMWDPETKLIKFVPGLPFTDPSYHLPHFYDLFAEWADPSDRPFWRSAAEASREFLPRACHPETGLAPEYSFYDGSPNHEQGHGDFFSDAYRVALNIGLDSVWTGGAPATDAIALKICSFFDKISADNFRSYRIDGTPLAEPALHPVGLIATNAVGAIAASRAENGKDVATRAVVRFMETPPRTGDRRYYDNCLYFFALLILSGRYRVW
jgi:alpha-glucuronidase